MEAVGQEEAEIMKTGSRGSAYEEDREAVEQEESEIMKMTDS